MAAELADVEGVEPDMTAAQLVELAARAGQNGRFDDAERILGVVVRNDLKNLEALRAAAYLYRARAADAGSRPDDPNAPRMVEEYINRAIRTYLEYAGPLALESGAYDLAEEWYSWVLRQRPGNPQAQLGLARVYKGRGSWQAIDLYNTYLNPQINPTGHNDPKAHLELGQVYRARRQATLAVTTLEKALQLDPEDPEILMELAQVYLESSKPTQALELARRAATEKSPLNPAYRNLYAAILLAEIQMRAKFSTDQAKTGEQLEEARTQAARAVQLAREELLAKPDDAVLLGNLDRYYQTYRQVFRGILARDPENVAARLELARMIQEHALVVQTLGLHRALQVLVDGAPHAQENAAYLEAMAELQYKVHKYADARQTCERLLKLQPDNVLARRLSDLLPAGSSGRGATKPVG